MTLKYISYNRKSSEEEERQALSIQSQLDKTKELFGNLEIVDYVSESASAFKPYNRPAFTEMIASIERGEANGIIAWHPDRLSRNPIEAGYIVHLLGTGVLKGPKVWVVLLRQLP